MDSARGKGRREVGARYINRLRALRLLMVLACCLLFALFSFSGCKYSDILTEHVEDPYAGVLDENAEPNYVEQWGAPEDPTRKSTLISDSDRIDEQEQNNPLYDQQYNEEQTNDTQNTEDTSHDDAAVSGTQSSDESGTSDTTKSGGTGSGDAATEGGQSDEVESDDTGEGHEETSGDTGNAGAGGATIIVDDGTYTELPENVGTVAAAGQYATIVQMLSGGGGLVAADKPWKDRVLEGGAFPNEGVEDITTVWSDGSDTSTLDVNALIALHPDAVLVDGNESCVSSEQADALVAAGITVVPVPELGKPGTSDESITTAVTYVGELLADSTTVVNDTSNAAAEYLKDRSEVLSTCETGNGGPTYKTYNTTAYTYYYQGEGDGVPFTSGGSNNIIVTAVIDDWVSADNPSPVAKRDYYDTPLYLNGTTLDASDGVGVSVKGTGGFMLIDYYLQFAGGVNNAYESSKPAAISNGQQSYSIIAGNPAGLFSRSIQVRERPSALWYKIADSSSYNLLTVGDSSFPGVLVRNSTISGGLESSAKNPKGLYNVGQPFKVWVIPSGLAGSWEDGTVESYLIAPWAFSIFRPNDAGSWSYYLEKMTFFYDKYYRCQPDGLLSDYSDQAGLTVGS